MHALIVIWASLNEISNENTAGSGYPGVEPDQNSWTLADVSVPIPLRMTCRREMIASLIICGQLALFDNCHPCRMLSRSFAVPLNRELLPLQAVVLGSVDHSFS